MGSPSLLCQGTGGLVSWICLVAVVEEGELVDVIGRFVVAGTVVPNSPVVASTRAWGGASRRAADADHALRRDRNQRRSAFPEADGAVVADFEIGEVVAHPVIASVLFVDLQNSRVLNVVGRENVRFLALQKKGGV